jgi:hypothetical protein
MADALTTESAKKQMKHTFLPLVPAGSSYRIPQSLWMHANRNVQNPKTQACTRTALQLNTQH